MTRLALMRHGHTDWNRAGRIQGRSDIPLDQQARTELSDYALPPAWTEAVLWASPLQRAAETARLVAMRDPKTSAALTEMNWGDWEGLRGQDLILDPNSGYRHIEDWGWDYRPPNGESRPRSGRGLYPGWTGCNPTPWLSAISASCASFWPRRQGGIFPARPRSGSSGTAFT